MDNGVELKLNFAVDSIVEKEDYYRICAGEDSVDTVPSPYLDETFTFLFVRASKGAGSSRLKANKFCT
jgi:hypothetical protein